MNVKLLPLPAVAAGALLAAFLPGLPAVAQTPAYVFTKLVDSNDLVPGADGVFFDPNQSSFDGATAVFWNGAATGPASPNAIWTVRARSTPLRLVSVGDAVPGGTGAFTQLFIDSQPGPPVIRDNVVVFSGRDSASSGYTGGIYSVSAAGGALSRVANRNVGGFTGGFQNFSLSAGRVAFNVAINNDFDVYAADVSGANLVALADFQHPARSGISQFTFPSISAGNVAFFGRGVGDPSNSPNALFLTPAAGGFGYGEVAGEGTMLPGNTNANFHTRVYTPRLDGSNVFFAADDSLSNFVGLYRSGGGGLTRIVDINGSLPGLTSITSFGSTYGAYAASGAALAYRAFGQGSESGIYVGDGAGNTKVVATGDYGPFADTFGLVAAVDLDPYVFVGGQAAVRVTSTFGLTHGLYLATPLAQSADLVAAVSAQPPSPAVGESTTLTFTVANQGPAAAGAPVATLALPPGVSFQSASSGGAFANGTITYALGNLPNGASASVSAVVRVDSPGSLTVTARAVGATADSNQRNNRAFVVLPAAGPRYANYLIKRIVDSATAIPDRAGQSFIVPGGSDPLPALDSGRVVFVAAEGDRGTEAAVWTVSADGSGGFTRVATTHVDAVPAYPGDIFTGFGSARLRNGTLTFLGATGTQHNGFYAAPAAGGAFRLLVNTSTPRPDRSAPFTFSPGSLNRGLLGDGVLSFYEGGLYAWPIQGGAGIAVAPNGVHVPVLGRGASPSSAGAPSGTRVAFGADANAVLSSFLDERRFESNAVARLTASPSGGAFADAVMDEVQAEGATVVFRASAGSDGSTYGIYSVTGSGTGPAVKLVDTQTPVPGGVGNFALDPFSTFYSFNGGEVVFAGIDASNNRKGIYSIPAAGGTIQKIVAVGDAISGQQTIQDLPSPTLQANALGQRQVVFHARYFDAATNVVGTGIYVATPASRLINLSTRARVETGDNVMIGGFVVTGTGTKKVIVRAIGPSLAAFVPGTIANPTLDLYNGQNQLIASNDDWKSNQAAVQATGLAPTNDLESAIVMDLAPGNYTAIVRGAGGAQGVALVEAYDLQPNGENNSGARLINVSTRARVQTGDNVMIGGLVIGAGPSRRVLIRALGPSLAAAVPGTLANPRVDLYDGQNQLIASNDDWQSALTAGLGTPAEISALGLSPTNAAESAILITLPPGSYTAIVRGQDGGSGVALVEAYEIP